MLGRKGMKRKAWAEDSPTAVGKPITFRTRVHQREALAEHASSGVFQSLETGFFVYSKQSQLCFFVSSNSRNFNLTETEFIQEFPQVWWPGLLSVSSLYQLYLPMCKTIPLLQGAFTPFPWKRMRTQAMGLNACFESHCTSTHAGSPVYSCLEMHIRNSSPFVKTPNETWTRFLKSHIL